ncbi:MAG: hypothetical protein C0506_00005, partial [Anaerolinea sp.]|nr:hypothetical protein [Anaerolinea sp.]
ATVFSVGAFLPILALNYAGAIAREMAISNPVEKAVVVLYVAVAAVAIVLQRSDVNRERVGAGRPDSRTRRGARGRAQNPMRGT